MRLVLSLLALCLTWNSFGSAADPVVCVPISAAQGPANSAGITPINCQIVANKTIIACYPTYQVNFPQQFPTRVSCTPMEPTTTTSTTTSTTTTTVTSTTVTPSTTEESSFDFVLCLPIRSCGCGSNGQGVDVIICFLVDIEIEIRCYPRFIDFIFGQNTPIECLPLDEITTTESTTEEPTTPSTTVATTEESSLEFVECLPIRTCGCGSNDQGIEVIICFIVDIEIEIRCYPRFIDFVFGQNTPIECLPLDEITTTESTTEEPTTTELAETEEAVICVPYAEIEDAESNENGIKPIYCMLISNHTIIICYPQTTFIFYAGPISQRILCVPAALEVSPAPSTAVAESSTTSSEVTCIPISPCGCGVNEDGVEAIKCLIIDIEIIVICFPTSSEFTYNNQTIQCVIVEGSSSAPASGEASAETEVATVAPIICVPVSPISYSEPNEEGVYPIECMTIDHVLIICYPQSQVIFVGPGEIQQRIFCVPVELQFEETTEISTSEGTTEVTTSTEEELESVICVPYAEIEGAESNENGAKPIYCMLISNHTIIICCPLEEFIFFPGPISQRILCVPVPQPALETTTTEVSTATSSDDVLCIPLSPCDGSSEESNEEGVKAIYCIIIDIDIIVKCYPKVIDFIWNQTSPIHCEKIEEVTLPSDSSSEEEETIDCIPFKPCEGSSEESNEEGVDAIYCLIIDIDIIVKCFPKEFGFDFNQTASIECVPVKEVIVSPPTDSGESEAIDCIPMSPCEGSSEESNENGVKAIMCWLIDIEIVVKCFPLIEGWTFNQTATIKCLPVEETTTTEIEEESSSTVTPVEPVFCIPFSPCDESNEEKEKDSPIMCWIVEINILIKCYPMVIDWTFNQTSTIECTPCEETTEATSATEMIETSTPESDVVFCIPFAPCGAETKVIQCLLIELDIIIICHPTTFDFAYNQTSTIECLLIEENPTTSETEETSVTEETATSEKYVQNVIDCHPLGPCGCGLVNEDNTEAIICEILYWGHIIICFPQTEDFVFNQTYTVPCQMIYPTAETETTPEPSEEVECIPLGPVENGESGLIQCKLIDEETVIECYPVTFNGFSTGVPSGSGETSSIASTTEGSIKCVPKLQGTTASSATTTTP